MFSSAEFIEEWNQIFSFKIKESDLSKPTETFVFNALINYLKMFNFDTGPMMQLKNSENVVDRRNFLIQFCHYIDHIYKISDKSHCFLYYDLLHPSPKKTVHMLNHLLNYLFYYNMFKESVIPLAYGKIRQMEEVVGKINTYKYENEQIEIKARMIEKTIEDYRSMVPQTASQLNELIAAESAEKENLNAMEEQINNCNSIIESLRNQEVLLTMEIVSQEEVDRLLTSKDILSNAIVEQEGIESSTYAKNQERSATVNKLQNIMSSIDTAMDLNPPTTLASHKEANIKYNELELKITEVIRRKELLVKNHEKLLEELKRTETDSSSKGQVLKEMKVSGEKEIEEVKLVSEASEASIGDFEHELHTQKRQLEEEKELSNYIIDSTAALVKATMENCFEIKTKEFL